MLSSVVACAALLLPPRPIAVARVHAPPRARAAPSACASSGDPAQVSPEELSNEVLRDIVLQRVPDQEVNELAWRCLGYTPDPSVEGGWSSAGVFPNWRKNYPQPPDLVGVTRTYSREVDEPVLRAVQALQRSVPREHKDQLKPALKPVGWQGFKMEGLTPNMTRRAQVSTWLLYFRRVRPPRACAVHFRCRVQARASDDSRYPRAPAVARRPSPTGADATVTSAHAGAAPIAERSPAPARPGRSAACPPPPLSRLCAGTVGRAAGGAGGSEEGAGSG